MTDPQLDTIGLRGVSGLLIASLLGRTFPGGNNPQSGNSLVSSQAGTSLASTQSGREEVRCSTRLRASQADSHIP